jgi:hypothetical protein
MENKTGKYILSHGCHRGTLMSRDSGQPEQFNTYDEAYDQYLEHKNFYHSIGYQIWFAKIIDPDGTEHYLESNPYY